MILKKCLITYYPCPCWGWRWWKWRWCWQCWSWFLLRSQSVLRYQTLSDHHFGTLYCWAQNTKVCLSSKILSLQALPYSHHQNTKCPFVRIAIIILKFLVNCHHGLFLNPFSKMHLTLLPSLPTKAGNRAYNTVHSQHHTHTFNTITHSQIQPYVNNVKRIQTWSRSRVWFSSLKKHFSFHR